MTELAYASGRWQGASDRPVVVVWFELPVEAQTSVYARGWACVMAAIAVAVLVAVMVS
jgi:hypothetical protein